MNPRVWREHSPRRPAASLMAGLQARIRCADSLNLIGGFCTLDLCDLNQLLDIGRFLTQV